MIPKIFNKSTEHKPVPVDAFLSDEFCIYDGHHRLILSKGSVVDFNFQGFEVLVGQDKRSVLVCFSGAVSNRGGKKAPFFSGKTVACKLDFPLISISDPSLSLEDDLSLGWYAGSKKSPLLIQEIRDFLVDLHAYLDVEFVIFGGSGGGFASLAVSTILTVPSKVLVWNPQTDISKYDRHHVDKYISSCFGESFSNLKDSAEFSARVKSFLSDAGVFNKLSKPPDKADIVYLQNDSDWHLKSHMVPFLRMVKECLGANFTSPSSLASLDNRINFFIGDWGNGHAPPPSQVIEYCLASFLSGLSGFEVVENLNKDDFSYICSKKALLQSSSLDSSAQFLASYHAGKLDVLVWPKNGSDVLEYAFWVLNDSGERVFSFPFSPQSDFLFDAFDYKDISSLDLVVLARDYIGSVARKRISFSDIVRDSSIIKEVDFSTTEGINKNSLRIVDAVGGSKEKDEEECGAELYKNLVFKFNKAQEEDYISFYSSQAIYRGNIVDFSLFGLTSKSVCRSSVYLSGANFLRFDELGECYYVVQVRRFFDGIYIPRLNIFFGRNLPSITNKVELLRRRLNAEPDFGYNQETRNEFNGFIFGQALPYHFFYDSLPAVHSVYKRIHDLKGAHFFFEPGSSYLNIEDFYDVVSSPLLCKEVVGFYIYLLRNESHGKKTMHNEVDVYLKKAIRGKKIKKEWSLGVNVAAPRPVIWLGVMHGKRTWLEQVEALSKLIVLVLSKSPSALFIFDGITTPSGSFWVESEGHENIIDKIVKNVFSEIGDFDYINLNGFWAENKVFYAGLVDFFVSDGATASIYNSRFYDNLGVVYSPLGASLFGHIHGPSTKRLPSDFIVNQTEARSWDQCDISIDPDDFVDFVVSEMLLGNVL